jgi:RNA-binding protein 8A
VYLTGTLAVEGWVLFATNVHAETQEEDLYDLFADYGQVSQIDLNLDRRTGFVKGYALVVYETKDQAERAIKELNGKDLFGQKLSVNWAFSRGSLTKKKSLTSATVRNKSAAQE